MVSLVYQLHRELEPVLLNTRLKFHCAFKAIERKLFKKYSQNFQ